MAIIQRPLGMKTKISMNQRLLSTDEEKINALKLGRDDILKDAANRGETITVIRAEELAKAARKYLAVPLSSMRQFATTRTGSLREDLRLPPKRIGPVD